ncbi:MAG: histidinol-phosphate transaminase [Acutalibacteraceae bacterium]|nr:histidinol-phosphate transaminase [Acutalibacteraceae bacterium]
MSRFFSSKYSSLEAYTPGEQPKDMKYIKLNTNESPFPPSPKVTEYAKAESEKLNLYSDPESRVLTQTAADLFDVKYENVLMTNGSDEILNFAFMAFCDDDKGIAFPSISYGFYPVFAELNHIPYKEIPLKDDFSINVEDYCNIGMNIVIANPNAPTGLALSVEDIEKIVTTNKDSVVIIDEAYVDFGAESVIPLTKKYDNLLVTQTFSKSRSLAGARLGFGIGNEALIADLNTIKYSTNPYNVNRMTSAAGIAALEDNDYYMNNCKTIAENREYTKAELAKLGFETLDSKANFIFTRCDKINGGEYYLTLKKMGILVRHFTKPLISDYVRITIGTKEQMDALLTATKEILGVK